MLEIRALGRTTLRFSAKEGSCDVVDRRRTLLMIYLAEMGAPQSRQAVAELLWPSSDAQLAMMSLRTLLTRMRSEGLAVYLEISRSTIALAADAMLSYDLAELRRVLHAGENATLATLLPAQQLYQGPFCADVAADRFPALREWADAVQYSLEAPLSRAFMRLTEQLLAQGAHEQAVQTGQCLIDLAPYDDHAQFLYGQALLASGQLLAARRHLASYRQVMAAEFPDLPIGAEIAQLDALLARPKRNAKVTPPSTPHVTLSMPGAPALSPATQPRSQPFIGRQAEAAWLAELLATGERLITVVGLGGVGKTMFVRQQLPSLAHHGPDGVTFVDLRSGAAQSEGRQELFPALSQALRLSPAPGTPLLGQLLAALSHGQHLLILDNAEHLDQESIAQLLAALPRLIIVATSRKRLGLADEALLTLRGLPVAASNAASSERSEAAQLFYLLARRLYPQFNQEQVATAQVEELCRRLGGLPLALQLAAQQLGFYTLADLLAAFEDYQTMLPAAATSHPSGVNLTTVLRQTWGMLSPEARAVLAQLSVFADRWPRAVMQAIVPASPAVYQELVDKAVLQIEAPGWFSLHPLIKQYAGGRLTGAAHHDVMSRYSVYFLGLFDLGERFLEQAKIMELANFRRLQESHSDLALAWQWAVGQQIWPLLEKAVSGLVSYYSIARLELEGIRLLQLLVDTINGGPAAGQQPYLTGLGSYGIGYLYGLMRDYGPAVLWRRQGIGLLQQTGSPWDLTITQAYFGHLLLACGQKDLTTEAIANLNAARVQAEHHSFHSPLIKINTSLIYPSIFHGHWHELRQRAEANRLLFHQQPTLIAQQSMVSLLQAYIFLDEAAKAEEMLILWEQAASSHADHHISRAWIGMQRAEITALSGNLPKAITQIEEASALFQTIDTQNFPVFIGNLALFQARCGDWSKAQQNAQHALHLGQALTLNLLSAQIYLRIAVVRLLARERSPIAPLLQQALASGLEIPNTALIFTALYYLTTEYSRQLPSSLYERIVKIACISPAMYYQDRPLARDRAAREGIVIRGEERDALWATDLAAVRALVQEVSAALPEVIANR